MNKPRHILDEPLHNGEEHWRRLVEALPQLVWSATPDGACSGTFPIGPMHRHLCEITAFFSARQLG